MQIDECGIRKGVNRLEDCIFCKIANKEIGKLVYEDEQVAAFDDLNPQAPVHVLVIPKKHIARVSEVTDGEDACLMGQVIAVANKIAADRGIAEEGYRIVVNCNEGAGQSVWHVHFHLLGGRKLGWPPG
jgi:histidine triad (HIT) family protein